MKDKELRTFLENEAAIHIFAHSRKFSGLPNSHGDRSADTLIAAFGIC
jgi:hypothetical protein